MPAKPALSAREAPYRQVLGRAASAAPLKEPLGALEATIKTYTASPPPQAKAIFSLVDAQDDLTQILALARKWRERFRTLVVVGSGGSGLSGKAISMLSHGAHLGNGHTLHVLDNMDTHAMPRLVDSLNLGNTCFLFISKSGSTVESYAMSQAILQALQDSGIRNYAECCAAITMAEKNPLRSMAEEHGIPVVTHDPDVCGRFSLLSAVGLIPAAFMGVDVAELRAGAAWALRENLKPGSQAAIGAALHYAMQEEGRNISIFMPYSEQLLGLAAWWRQGWAESLGKEGQGSTPLVATGTADQHSQLQLFLDGPDDKFFTLLLTDCAGKGMKLPDIKGPLSYLSNHRLGDLAAAQQRATAETLERHARPLRVFELSEPDAFTFGALAMHFTLEILFTAALMQVNPFDQPAVEQSKRLAHEYLTKI